MNKLIIAAAGSGKTTYLVNQAKEIKTENVLITTYTEANEAEIKKKFNGHIPKNVTIQTWFSFLLKHGVSPYQSEMHDELHEKKIGFYLSEDQSGKKRDCYGKVIEYTNPETGKKHPIYYKEEDFFKYYFTKDLRIYSDKIAEFIVKCNKKTNNEIISRIARIYPYIFIDEVQDLAGWELYILKLLFKSKVNVLLVGDPRQVTYLTHPSKKYKKYRDGKIADFIFNECNGNRLCEIDETTLIKSHRNNKHICVLSSKLFPEYLPCEPCNCNSCKKDTSNHEGIFLIKESDAGEYCIKYNPQILRN